MQYSHARPSVPVTRRHRGTVLVIDDDDQIRPIIADVLGGQDYAAEQAADRTSGLQLAEQVQPDVILLDLALPMRSSLEIRHRLKERQPTRDVPISWSAPTRCC